jgi:hypothetical protein
MTSGSNISRNLMTKGTCRIRYSMREWWKQGRQEGVEIGEKRKEGN